MWLCSIDAEPFKFLPGGNLFMAQQDLSHPPTAEGTSAIHCQPISDMEAYHTTAKGWNYLRRILAGIASA